MTETLDRAFCILGETGKFRAIDEVIARCPVFDDVPSRTELEEAVHRREEEMSTGIGHGVAIAHGKIPGIRSTHVALGFSEEGIRYDDINPEPVHFLFVIASSPSGQADYLKTVSALLSWVHDPAFREAFIADRGCPAARRFLAMLSSQVFSAQKTE